MLSRFFEQILVLASISPIFIALWFSEFLFTGNPQRGIFWLVSFSIFVILSYEVVKFSLNTIIHLRELRIYVSNKQNCCFK